MIRKWNTFKAVCFVVVHKFVMPAAVENSLHNVALAVSAEEYEGNKYQLQGPRLSTDQSQQLIINILVLMVIVASTMQVMRKGRR
jgi:hypothetical protein